MKNQNILKKILIFIFGTSISLSELTFEVNWVPYVAYYISSLDISTGKSEVPIFSAVLDPGDDEYEVSIEFFIKIGLGHFFNCFGNLLFYFYSILISKVITTFNSI